MFLTIFAFVVVVVVVAVVVFFFFIFLFFFFKYLFHEFANTEKIVIREVFCAHNHLEFI